MEKRQGGGRVSQRTSLAQSGTGQILMTATNDICPPMTLEVALAAASAWPGRSRPRARRRRAVHGGARERRRGSDVDERGDLGSPALVITVHPEMSNEDEPLRSSRMRFVAATSSASEVSGFCTATTLTSFTLETFALVAAGGSLYGSELRNFVYRNRSDHL